MLQGVETEIGEPRRFRVAVDAEHAALVAKFVRSGNQSKDFTSLRAPFCLRASNNIFDEFQLSKSIGLAASIITAVSKSIHFRLKIP